ncbi:MAG: RES domain-containing protein [Gemmatimonadaceae bacterium]
MAVVYRVAKKRYVVYDASGSVLNGGRWSSPGVAVIYAAEHYATAILEQLVHAGRLALPGAHHAAAIVIPDNLRVERFDPTAHPGWDSDGSQVARDYGDAWVAAARTPVLQVPSVPGQPVEWNYVINPGHREAARIRPLPTFDVVWDGRLFGPTTGTVRVS